MNFGIYILTKWMYSSPKSLFQTPPVNSTSHLYQATFMTPAPLKIHTPMLLKTSYTFTRSEILQGCCLKSITKVSLNHVFVSSAWQYVAPFPIWHGIPQRLHSKKKKKKKFKKYLIKILFHINLFLLQLTLNVSSQFSLINHYMLLRCK